MSEQLTVPRDIARRRKPVLIYRQVTLSLSAFDRLKAWQRRLELAEDRKLTNGEVLDALILAVPYP